MVRGTSVPRAKKGDVLRDPVFEDLEIVLVAVHDERAVCVSNGERDVDQLHVDLDSGLG